MITGAQWSELEKPLREIDSDLAWIADHTNAVVSKNYHSWPSRSLQWLTSDGINRKLEIALEENMTTYHIIGYAWYDIAPDVRYGEIVRMQNNIRSDSLLMHVDDILSYMRLLNDLGKEDLTVVRTKRGA